MNIKPGSVINDFKSILGDNPKKWISPLPKASPQKENPPADSIKKGANAQTALEAITKGLSRSLNK